MDLSKISHNTVITPTRVWLKFIATGVHVQGYLQDDIKKGLGVVAQPLLAVGGGEAAVSAEREREPSPHAATSKPLVQTVRMLHIHVHDSSGL